MASNKKGEVIIPENVRSIVTKYIIHFNIDNTLLLPDCQHESREDQLIQILVHYAWGKIDEKNKFKLSQNVFTKVPKDPESTSYYQALDQLYPLTNDSEENEKIMKTRQDTILNFLKVGTGMKLKPDFDKISKTLQLPKVIHDEIFAVSQQMKSNEVGLNDITDIQKTILQLFQSGYVYILPTLYKTFQNLKKAKKEFSIIFRSSNKQNLEKFVAEFNLFCSGEHPQFNGKNNIPLIKHDGQKNTKNYIIHPSQQVSVFENAGKSLGLEAVFGKLDNQKQGDLESQYAKEIQQEKVKVESGERIYTRMLDSFKESCSMAICENGTQLLVDTYDYNVLQIYFDGEKNTQFQARNIITGEVLPNPEKYLIRVSIIDLFKDQDLFMKAIMNAEATRNDEIQRIEKGQELKKNSVTNDWQTLQQSSHDDYLRKTILPLLHPVFIQKQALNLVDIERPDDPISFIAMYILNNKSQVKLPKASQQQQQQDENIQEKQF